jgi:uncharacterized membrane protein HdeD (DUF308 family)
MIRLLIQNWWMLLMRGALALAFAVFIFVFMPFMPAPLLRELAFAGLVVIFALFAIATGVITIAAAVWRAGQGASWLLLADGIIVTTGGLVILISPALTLAHVILLIAVTSLLLGTLEIVAGFHLRRHITDEWLFVSGGVISVAFAAVLLFIRGGDPHSVLTWISIYATASGLAMVGLAFRLRGLRNSIHGLAGPPQAKAQSGAA